MKKYGNKGLKPLVINKVNKFSLLRKILSLRVREKQSKFFELFILTN